MKKAIYVETHIRDIFSRIDISLFSDKEVKYIITSVNRRVLNAIPIDFEQFLNFQDFEQEHGRSTEETSIRDIDLLRNEWSRYFLASEILHG